jgi:hypothetical protein
MADEELEKIRAAQRRGKRHSVAITSYERIAEMVEGRARRQGAKAKKAEAEARLANVRAEKRILEQDKKDLQTAKRLYEKFKASGKDLDSLTGKEWLDFGSLAKPTNNFIKRLLGKEIVTFNEMISNEYGELSLGEQTALKDFLNVGDFDTLPIFIRFPMKGPPSAFNKGHLILLIRRGNEIEIFDPEGPHLFEEKEGGLTSNGKALITSLQSNSDSEIIAFFNQNVYQRPSEGQICSRVCLIRSLQKSMSPEEFEAQFAGLNPLEKEASIVSSLTTEGDYIYKFEDIEEDINDLQQRLARRLSILSDEAGADIAEATRQLEADERADKSGISTALREMLRSPDAPRQPAVRQGTPQVQATPTTSTTNALRPLSVLQHIIPRETADEEKPVKGGAGE